MTRDLQQAPAPPKRTFKVRWAVILIAIAATAVFAWSRMGLLDLPSVPSGLTLEQTGLANLDAMRRMDQFLRGPAPQLAGDYAPSEAAMKVRKGLLAVQAGQVEEGLAEIRAGVRLEPDNLVLTNAYRMVVFRLKRDFLLSASSGSILAPEFPPHLAGQPIEFLEELDAGQHTRESRIALALAWVDHMLLFPALEIKAPASVEAVDLLTDLIEQGNRGYVPAYFARGMNHLHRPTRLVWPETMRTAPDAAAKDIGTCVAIGREFKGGSDRLQATLAIALGDAYVKAGRLSVARSWWQIAQNLSNDEGVQAAVRRRYGWRDENILDRLEEELDRSRSELDHPMTDLAFMWN